MNLDAIGVGSLAVAFPILGYSAGCLWAAIRDLRAHRAAAEVRRLTTLPAPVEHREADEAYADELAATRDDIPSVDLRTTAEQMAVDHAALDGIGDALDRFGEAVDHALRLFLRGNDPTDLLRVARWSGDSVADTGTFDQAELDALLADDELAGVR